MNINNFYTQVLGANLRNPRWSWGAHDPLTDRLYLRVWEDQIVERDGQEHVLVQRERPGYRSPGKAERDRHLEMLQDGTATYAVVCAAKSPDKDRDRNIKSFDESELLRLGSVATDGDERFAHIVGRVPVTALMRPPTGASTLTEDVIALSRKKGEPTTKEALVSARVGQGAFRTAVLAAWGDRCAVTGARTLDAIRASHIKPWRDSEDEERLDPANGLPLVATLDALFDAGLISFEDSGAMLISPLLDEAERGRLGVTGLALITLPSPATATYLAYHRDQVLRS